MHLVAIVSYMTQNVQMEENISTLMDEHTALEKGPSVGHPHIQWSDLHADWRKIVGAVNPGSGLTIWSEEVLANTVQRSPN
jgi:hypothetical protein